MHYDDLRRFSTAVADDEEERVVNTEYIPSGLQQGEFVHEGADNVDIQVNTIDMFNNTTLWPWQYFKSLNQMQ